MAKIALPQGITFDAPTGTTLDEALGADSQVGKISGPGFQCKYDLGLNADPLTRIADAALSETTLSGHPARLMQKGSSKDALHVMQVGKSVLGEIKLTLHCTSSTEQARDAVRAMFQTLHIPS